MSLKLRCPHCSLDFDLVSERAQEYLGIIKKEIEEKEVLSDEDNLTVYEDLEDLRLYLNTFLRPPVLQALLEISKVLNLEPKFTQMVHYFIRNSAFGKECRFCVMAANNFKKKRMEKILGLLKKCSALVEEDFKV